MPADRSWGLNASGETFEALVTTLVFFEGPKAALLGRRGPDGGQDAVSGDGKLVHQAKFHTEATAAKAIADGKKEVKRIAKYRVAGHPREPRWRLASNWRLWTNATFNDANHQRWKDEVVPLSATFDPGFDHPRARPHRTYQPTRRDAPNGARARFGVHSRDHGDRGPPRHPGAAQLPREAIQGGPRYRSDLSGAVDLIGARVVAELSNGQPRPARLGAVKALLTAALSFERSQVFERGDSLVPSHCSQTIPRGRSASDCCSG